MFPPVVATRMKSFIPALPIEERSNTTLAVIAKNMLNTRAIHTALTEALVNAKTLFFLQRVFLSPFFFIGYVYHVAATGSLGGQLKCDNEPIKSNSYVSQLSRTPACHRETG